MGTPHDVILATVITDCAKTAGLENAGPEFNGVQATTAFAGRSNK